MTVTTTSRIIHPAGNLKGELIPPPDKSITHRAVIFASLASGPSRVVRPLIADDCERTAEAFRSLGVSMETDRRGDWIILGKGMNGLERPAESVYCGNSGTTMRLLTGVLSGQPFEVTLMGDASLSRRPMDRVVLPVRQMGAQVRAQDNKFAPLVIQGKRPLDAMEWKTPVASAQVKSCVLLAGLYADGVTVVEEPYQSRDHTERMMSAAGIQLDIQGTRVGIRGGQSLQPREWVVPSDLSSAAFFIVASLLLPGSEVLLRNVGVNPTRDGLLEVMQQMGVLIKRNDQRVIGGEPIADLLVTHSPLKSVKIEPEIMPRLIDEIPIIAVAATQAEGITEIRGAQELRVKESDRLAHCTTELRKMGAHIEERPDGLVIEGPTPLIGATVNSFEDHRMAMSLAVAGLIARGETVIQNADCVDISFPTFWDDLEKLRNRVV
ncbi:MAG TPA: 3-phosphoshikimate 1-carboxyvinyltransferase [Elusimicrobiota bacterium]|nr:3-phosphoshikimate 1-carboxyvinyltransferase [Elusimicrobiota bacterium]